MKKQLIAVVLMFSMFILLGCVQNPSGTGVINATNGTMQTKTTGFNGINYDNITISEFSVLKTDSGNLKLQIVLADTSKDSYIAADGTAHVKITTEIGTTAWEGDFEIKKEEFEEGQRALTGAPVLYWHKYIKKDEIKSPRSSGEAYLELTLPNGKKLTAKDTLVSLPITYELPPTDMYLFVDEQDDYYEVKITLYDKYNEAVKPNGTLTITIVDENSTLFNKTYEIGSENYSGNLGDDIIIEIPTKDVEKSFNKYGELIAVFKAENATVKKVREYLDLPTPSEEEINSMFEEEYQKKAVNVNKKIKTPFFEFTVLKYGWFKEYDSLSEKVKQYFRIDVKMKNTGDDDYCLPSSDLVLVDSAHHQYDPSWDSEFDACSLKRGSIAGGYLLYEDVPKAGGLELVVPYSGTVESDNILGWEYIDDEERIKIR